MANQWRKTERRINERIRLIVQEGYTETASKVITRSPVDKSVFRNQWYASLNQPSTKLTTIASTKDFGEKGGIRFTEFLALSTEFDIGDKLFLTNNSPQSRRLEFGWSKQAPAGMVRISAAEWPLLIDKIARRIR